jgi:hypothetical protein
MTKILPVQGLLVQRPLPPAERVVSVHTSPLFVALSGDDHFYYLSFWPLSENDHFETNLLRNWDIGALKSRADALGANHLVKNTAISRRLAYLGAIERQAGWN